MEILDVQSHAYSEAESCPKWNKVGKGIREKSYKIIQNCYLVLYIFSGTKNHSPK